MRKIHKHILLVAVMLGIISLDLYAQTGPAGVGNGTNNIIWLDAQNISGTAEGGNFLGPWIDKSGNGNNSVTNSSLYPRYRSNAINGQPGLEFDGVDDAYGIDNATEINTGGPYFEKTFIMVFETSDDVSSKQLLYEQGGGTRGFDIYIDDGRLYFAVWNRNNDGAGSDWDIVFTSEEVSENRPYVATFEFDGNNNVLNAYLNEKTLTPAPIVPGVAGTTRLYVHGGLIGVAAADGDGRYHNGGTAGRFKGDLSEIIAYNDVLTEAERNILLTGLGIKYGIYSTTYYEYTDFTEKFIGIGQESGLGQTTAVADGTLQISTPSDLGDGEYLVLAEKEGAAGWNASSGAFNVQTSFNSWRVDEQGDVGDVTYQFDLSSVAALPADFTKYGVLIDNDLDFSNATTYELRAIGGGIYEIELNLQKGDYIHLAAIKPTIQFVNATEFVNEDAGTTRFPMALNHVSLSDYIINYDVTIGGTAILGSDFTSPKGARIISAGAIYDSANVTIADDPNIELSENFFILIDTDDLSLNVENNDRVDITILDNDNTTKVEFVDPTSQSPENVQFPTISLNLNEKSTFPVIVTYTIEVISATYGVDFRPTPDVLTGTRIFIPNDTSEVITLEILDDLLYEGDETIRVTLSNPVNANLGTNTTHIFTIQENETPPNVSFVQSSRSALEQISDTRIQLRLDKQSTLPTTVTLGVVGGSTTAQPEDYTLSSTTVTFSPLDTIVNLPLSIDDDIDQEGNEFVTIGLSSPVNATLGSQTTTTYTILDDDGLGWYGPGGVASVTEQLDVWLRSTNTPGFSDGQRITNWEDISVNNAANISHNATVESRGNHNAPLLYTTTTNWNGRPVLLFDGDNRELFKLPQDEALNTNSVPQDKRTLIVAFRPGNDVTRRQVVYEEGGGVRGINIYIDQDTLYVGAYNKVNDDPADPKIPWDYIPVRTKIEPNTPYFAILEFDFNGIDGFVTGSVNGTTLGSQPGAGRLFRHPDRIGLGGRNNDQCFADGTCVGSSGDYFSGHIAEFISGNIVYNDAQRILVHNYLSSSYNMVLPVVDDHYDYDVDHSFEVFGIGQENATNFHNLAQGSGIIRIDNPSDLADGRYMLIGHNDLGVGSWTSTNAPTDLPNIEAVEQVWRVDKEGGDLGSVSFRVDTTRFATKPFGKDKYVLIVDSDGDFSTGSKVYELAKDVDEYYSADNINFKVGDYFTIGVAKPTIEFLEVTSQEREDQTNPQVILVRSNFVTQSDLTVSYTITGGTATAGGTDYTLSNGTVTILRDSDRQYIPLVTNNDGIIETDETVDFSLSNPPVDAALGTNTNHTFTILDDDNSVKIQFAESSRIQDEIITSYNIPVHISEKYLTDNVTVNYTITGGSATRGIDYILADGTVTINSIAGDTLAFVPLVINNDFTYELDETIEISLSSPVNANLQDTTTFTYTIRNDDVAPEIRSLVETLSGSESFSPISIPIRLSTLSSTEITLYYEAEATSTAVGGGIDFILNGSVTIPIGVSNYEIILNVFNDLLEENTETVVVRLLSADNATISPTRDVCTYQILDDDNVGWFGPGGVDDNKQYDIWLKSDELTYADNALVNGITDFSGDNKTINGVGGQQPTFQSDAVNSVNDRGVLSFDGINDLVQVTNNGDINTSGPYTIKTVMVAFQTSSNLTGKQVIYEQGGGTNGLNIYLEGNTLYYAVWSNGTGWDVESVSATVTPNSTYFAMLELDVPNQRITGYLNGTKIGDNIGNVISSLGNHSGGIGIGAINGSTRFHDKTTVGSGLNFEGKIMEYLSYNTLVNSGKRKIIENYFAAKYDFNPLTTLYDFSSTHSYEVFGIGQDNLSNSHYIAQGSGFIRVDNPTQVQDGSFMLFGHDNAGISSWNSSEIGIDSVQRVDREWKVDYKGPNLGAFRFAVDTTKLPALPGSYTNYVLLIDKDKDGDFNTGTIETVALKDITAEFHYNSELILSPGDVITLGIAINRTTQDGDWNDPDTWLVGVPKEDELAIISETNTITVTSDEKVGEIIIATGATLDMGSGKLEITSGTITNNGGTFNGNTGEVVYSATGDQCITGLTYYKLSLSGSGTKTLCGNTIVNNDITMIGSVTLDVDNTGNYEIELHGNWQNAASFNSHSGTIVFAGGNTQQINSTSGDVFHNIEISKTAGTVVGLAANASNVNTTINNTLTLTEGILDLNAQNTLILTRNNTTAITRTSGYILSEETDHSAKLQLNVGSAAGVFTFPFGNSSGEYIPFTIESTSGSLGTVTLATYNTPANNLPMPPTVTHIRRDINENSANLVNRFWQIDKSSVGGVATATFTYGDSEVPTNGELTLGAQRWNSTNNEWDTYLPGQVADAISNTVQVPGITEFSPWALSITASPLPVELIDFEVKFIEGEAHIYWTTLTEKDNKEFFIERSVDGENFEVIANVEGAGNSNEALNYHKIDYDPLTGISYYRLKQVDFDGTVSYSAIVKLTHGESNEEDFDFYVFPNPTNHGETIFVRTTGHQVNEEMRFSLYNMYGGKEYTKVLQADNHGVFVGELYTGHELEPGVYLLVEESQSKNSTQKIIIK